MTGKALFSSLPHCSDSIRPTRRGSFPGSQPVSFGTKDLERLENEE